MLTKCRYAKCRYAQCRYAECRVYLFYPNVGMLNVMLNVAIVIVVLIKLTKCRYAQCRAY